MKTLIRIEELALTVLAFYLFLGLPYAWWWFFALFLAPDLSMIGYVAGPRIGAASYNLVHHQAAAVALFVLGGVLAIPWIQATGLILLAHSNMDRVMGYGLKYSDSFQHTHLGAIGRENPATGQ